MPKTVVVCIENLVTQRGAGTFTEFSASTQIQYYAHKIEAICRQLARDQPDADNWIVAWREYGITGAGSKFLTQQERAEFKQVMQALSAKYPKLTIIAGTIATAIDHKDEKHLGKPGRPCRYLPQSLFSSYQANLSESADDSGEFSNHRLQALSHAGSGRVVRNTCYIFAKGAHTPKDKTAPWKETEHLYSYAFQPGNSKNRDPVVQVTGHNLIIDICREHYFGQALHHQLSHDQSRETPLPHIHFVLSSSIPITWQHVAGIYLVHLDSIHDNTVSIRDDLLASVPTHIPTLFFKCDLFSEQLDLQVMQPQRMSRLPQSSVLYPEVTAPAAAAAADIAPKADTPSRSAIPDAHLPPKKRKIEGSSGGSPAGPGQRS